MPATDPHDVVVIGGGSAGCVLAAGLAQNSARSCSTQGRTTVRTRLVAGRRTSSMPAGAATLVLPLYDGAEPGDGFRRPVALL
jgi:glycine/D-amino acid oxidase-like deaminating enzyme